MNIYDLIALSASCAESIYGERRPSHHYAMRVRDLLIGTAATESHLTYRRQRGYSLGTTAGAWGLWQTESAPLVDSMNYLRRNTAVRQNAARWLLGDNRLEMEGVLNTDVRELLRVIHDWDRLACLFARLHYMRFAEPIPLGLDAASWYWKKYYNTFEGKGTPEKYRDDWQRLVQPALDA